VLVALVAALSTALVTGLTLARPMATVDAVPAANHYVVVLAATEGADGSFDVGGADALNLAAARSLVAAAGGTITSDLSAQIGVLLVSSDNAAFADTLRASSLVEAVGTDWAWKQYPTLAEGTASGEVTVLGGGPEQTADTLEPLQWSMQQIHAPEAHAYQAGWSAVDVGILDTGIDGAHPDFALDESGSNVDCTRGRNSITFLADGGPGAGVADPCIDNAFHGTHVAGIVAARANDIGVAGVAPNVTLVPVKVCDSSGMCYAGAVVDGITYAGDQKLDVINMSFFVDDNEFQASTEFKCRDDQTQWAFRRAVERALKYARGQGVALVAALGNSDQDLNNPVGDNDQPISNDCEVVPAESEGVVGVTALGSQSQKASYSNYGYGPADVAAPGGTSTGDCTTGVLSTFPVALGAYGCISGTSMASPHAAGVAALIVSHFGTQGRDGDVRLSPGAVGDQLAATAVDIGLAGYDECFGNGRIDALRAVLHDTTAVYDPAAPFCPEYTE
jgi:subtilisin family serine protease